ncbi:transcriptional attenuator, LytR family [Rivularia sp. PCC 7116]|uniref:LCP family protein n=1 Tax=Rivularia sp. PCC 7116 TaxID=373994 RepID=UPI00029EC7F3|nr:LCP family protein [Rivularia sp. PCC 7116]AFY54659.1 transcriptional attenuator, LytR family [Rivularia sp. PCC 7116]
MVKQVEGWQKPNSYEQEQELQNQPPVNGQLVKVEPRSSKKTSSIPSQLYYRLGLAMPRWLFWIFTVVMGITLSGLLVSSLALWTPLWSGIEKSDSEFGWSPIDADDAPLPGALWSNISQYQLRKPMNILVLGIEPVPGTVEGSPESFSGTSDTMLLVRFNPQDKSIRVLSIPKGTMISIPEEGLNKVSQANAFGGPVLAARVVSRSLSNAPIHRYIRISTAGMQQLVDQLGGVEVFVPKAMQYKDSAQKLSINLVGGWQTLNGEQAQQFVRYKEKGSGDLERVQRQQTMLLALRERLWSPKVLPRLPQLTRVMRKYFDTNLKLEEMMALVNFASQVERDDFQMTMLPGIFSALSADPDSYWLNLTGQGDLLSNYTGMNLASLKQNTKPLTSLKIAIQNTGNRPEQTQKTIEVLKKQGFVNVYAVANWPDKRAKSEVIVQKGNKAAAQELQQILGINHIDISATGDIKSDLTIRLGKDWKQ